MKTAIVAIGVILPVLRLILSFRYPRTLPEVVHVREQPAPPPDDPPIPQPDHESDPQAPRRGASDRGTGITHSGFQGENVAS